MRHRIILVIAALTTLIGAVSCVKKTIFEPSLEDDAISFSWYTMRSSAVTKADPDMLVGGGGAATHLPTGESFGVFGYFHPQHAGVAGGWNDGGDDNHPNLFYNEEVAISETAGVYSYSYENTRFWPRNQLDRISFLAYFPYNPGIADGEPEPGTIVESFLDKNYERDGMVGFYYTVPENSEEHVDFMVSDLCMDQSKSVWTDNHAMGLTGNANGKVKFFFHHALCQVRVKAVLYDNSGNEDAIVHINYIRFNNVPVFGQCIPVPDYDSTTDTGRTTVEPTWPESTLSITRPDLTSGVGAGVCFDDPEDPASLIPDNILLLIPHTFSNEASFEINFDVKRKQNGNGEYYDYASNTLSAPLKTVINDVPMTGWQAGKIYTYVINLTLRKIVINADETDWIISGEDILFD